MIQYTRRATHDMCEPKAREDRYHERGRPHGRAKSFVLSFQGVHPHAAPSPWVMFHLFFSPLHCTHSHLLILAALDNDTRVAVPHCGSANSGATKACTGINPRPTTRDPTESGPLRILHSLRREDPFDSPSAAHSILGTC